jgi:large repetitive protein
MRTVGMRVAVLLSAVVAVAAAHAAPFTVNSTMDAVDATPGDGVCATAAATCTLRAAVQEANAHASPDDITLPAGTYALSLTGSKEDAGATGDLDVHDELQVNGAGAATTIIDGLDGDRVFHVVAATFALRDVTIRGGQSPEDGENPFASMGGGVFVDDAAGGGTFERVTFRENSSPIGGSGLAIASNASPITLSGCTFDGNSSTQGPALHVNTTGPVSLTDTTLTSNTSTNVSCGGGTITGSTVTISGGDVSDNVGAGCGGLGIQASDGITIDGTTFRRNQSSGFYSGGLFALATAGAVSLTNVEASENAGANGGGIGITATGDVALTKVRVLDNGTSTSLGGGLTADVGGALTIVDSTISGNVCGAGGGGGVFLGASALSIEGTTIAQNQATGDGIGGGGFITAATLTITNSTISGNAAPFLAGGLLVTGTGTIRNVTFVDNDATTGSAIYGDGGTVTMVSSIIAGAAADHCVGTVTSGGNNLDSDGSCAFAAPGDQNDVDPQLGPLADNGGPTLTHLPSIGSPVLDRGAATDCPATDQRGEARPVDADGDGTPVCDVGAVEVYDDCPDDPAKLDPGICGCGVADDEAMANGTPDCFINGELKARIARAKAIIAALTSDQDPTEAELDEIGGSFKPYLTQFDGQLVLSGKKKKVRKLAQSASKAIRKVTKAKAGGKLDKTKKAAPKALDRFDATVAPQA